MAIYSMRDSDLRTRLCGAGAAPTFAPRQTGRATWLDSCCEDVSLEAMFLPRPAQSAKGFFLPASELVARYGREAPTETADAAERVVLASVRACELRAISYLDKVFLSGDFEDAAYRRRREGTTIVSCDCVDCAESCCCTLVGGEPFCTEGYDVSLTRIDGGILAEAATDVGEQWLAGGSEKITLPEATAEQIAQRQEIHESMTRRVEQQNARFGFSADDARQPGLPDEDDVSWQQFAADCVECGACTNICPTCHCFYLYDQTLGPEAFERVRNWDSCLLSTYHRMAGTPKVKGTPRPKLLSRLANRVLHKFTYSPEQYGVIGCTGCGRCIDACLGAIDIREMVQVCRAGAGTQESIR